MSTAKILSRLLLVLGFFVLLYYVLFVQANETPTDSSGIFELGLIIIVFGIVANTFSVNHGSHQRSRGFRTTSIGFGLVASGILLENHMDANNMLIVLGFVVFAGGILIAIPTFKQ